MDFSPENNHQNQQDEYEDDSDEILVETASFDHEGEADASTYNFRSDCPQAANLMELKNLSDNAPSYMNDERFRFAQGKKEIYSLRWTLLTVAMKHCHGKLIFRI